MTHQISATPVIINRYGTMEHKPTTLVNLATCSPLTVTVISHAKSWDMMSNGVKTQ